MPAGRSRSSGSAALTPCASDNWIRRSTARTASRYWSSRRRSAAPRPRSRCARSSVTESRMLRSLRSSASRSARVPPPPKSRSKTTRGLFSIGSGVVGVRHATVFM